VILSDLSALIACTCPGFVLLAGAVAPFQALSTGKLEPQSRALFLSWK
jgi:hypothetical protein